MIRTIRRSIYKIYLIDCLKLVNFAKYFIDIIVKNKLPHYTLTGILLLISIGFHSCFTGVEGTKKITLSKKELSSVAPTEEERYLSDIFYKKVGEWKAGHEFQITDDKFNIVVDLNSNSELKSGDIISFLRVEERLSPDGNNKSAIIFSKDGKEYRLNLEKSLSEISYNLNASNLPMMIDLEIVNSIKDRLQGKKLWTRTPLWYGDSMKYKKGKKFIPIIITSVEPGDSFFPVKINFTEENGEIYSLLMNVGGSNNETRNFAKLFFLKDPRRQYKNISDENWTAIQEGQIRLGMTKEECRLSLGNPSDTNIGHDYSRALELWSYPDGTFVQFSDDIVVNFRRQ